MTYTGDTVTLTLPASVLYPISPTQHCTSRRCDYTLSHTAQWCGYRQPRRCGCAFCYPE